MKIHYKIKEKDIEKIVSYIKSLGYEVFKKNTTWHTITEGPYDIYYHKEKDNELSRIVITPLRFIVVDPSEVGKYKIEESIYNTSKILEQLTLENLKKE